MNNREFFDLNSLIKYDDNSLEIRIKWDKYNSGLLCRKTFTWVDENNLQVDIKISPSESVELVLYFRKLAGWLVKEIIKWLFNREKVTKKEVKQTIIIINNGGVININNIKGINI